jgi:hypothetical protein
LSNAVINTTSTTATVNKTEDNRIQISSEKACKVAISVKDSNWLSAITLNYTLSVNTKKPTVKLAKSTLTLNSLYGKVSATTDLTLSQANLSASNLKDTVLTAAKATSETAKLDVQLFNGQITASIIDTTIKNGSYAFYFIPEYVNGDTTTTLAKVTVTVKVINTAPTGKLSKTSVSLNNKFSSLGTEFTVIPTDKDVTVTNVNIVSTAKANTAAYNNAQKINFNYEDGVVKVKLDESNVPATGSYSFKVTATVQNQFGIATMKALNLAVRVVNTVPKVKLSASTLSLNRITNLAGVESASLTVSSATSGYTVVSCEVARADTNANLLAQSNKISVTAAGNVVTAILNSADVAAAGSYKFKVTPIVKDDATGQQVKLSPVSFTVRVYSNASYSATVSASGSLNVLNRSKGITYTVTKLNNVVGEVTGVELIGRDAGLFDLGDLGTNAKGQRTVELKLKTDGSYSTKTTYSVQLQFTLKSGITVKSQALNLKVTQPAIKAKATPTTRTVYQAQSTSRVITYQLSLSSPTGAKIGDVTIGSTTALKNAVESITAVVNKDGTATVTVKLKDPSKLTANKSYTIPVTIKPADQASNLNVSTKLNLTLKAMK